MIPYGRQDITEDDIQAVAEVLRSDFLTQGPAIAAFEESFARYCGVKYAVAVSSATAGLHIACLALGAKPGKLVWTSANTFVASANCALYCGADVDFVDIDPHTWNMSVDALRKKLAAAKAAGKLPDIVIPVHFSGQSCDLAAMRDLSREYGFKIIEDAAHCAGASYRGKKVGSCDYSDLCVFSLHPVKIITSGEGGIVTTNSKEIYDRMMRLRTHGITRDPAQMTKPSEGPWYFQQLDLGYHYRMTDIHAVLGSSQLRRIDGYVERRRDIVARYDDHLKNLPITLPTVMDDSDSSWHLYVIRVHENGARKSRNEVFDFLREKGIGVNLHYIPVYLHPYFEDLGFKPGLCPEAESYYAQAITLPLFPAMKDEDVDYVCQCVKEAVL